MLNRCLFSRVLKCLVLFVLVMLVGCGNSDIDSSGELTSFNVSGSISGAVSGLQLLLQNQDTEAVYLATVEENGSFSVDVGTHAENDAGNVFFVSIISNNRYVGAVVDTYETADTEVSTGISIASSETDLVIGFDANKGVGILSDNDNTITFNSTFKTRLSSEKPVGMGSVGKGALSKTTTLELGNKLDKDQDGVPNLFDAMDNGEDLDNTNITTSVAAIAGSAVVSQAIMFMNYKIDVGATDTTMTNNANITIEVKANDASRITSIVADSVHAHYASSTTTLLPIGFTAIDSFPSQGTLWSDTGNALYHAQNMAGEDIWTVFLKPNNNDFVAGDLIRLKATLTDGSEEYYWVTIHFKFEDSQLPVDFASWTDGGSGTTTDPYCILDTGGRVFNWAAPRDSSGGSLSGLDYAIELFYLENASPESVVHEGVAHVYDLGEDVTYSDGTGDNPLTQAHIDLYESASPSPNLLQVDIKASYEYGDNTALKIYLARKKWGEKSGCPE